MVLGQDEAIDETTRQDWRDSGLSHLLAVSGQNVMLLVALAMPLLALVRMGPLARGLVLLGLIALYVPLAGAGPSLQRAGVMGAAGIAAMTLSRPASRWYALLLAAAATLALNPRVSADPGWQLSFAAVAGILALGRPLGAALARAGEELSRSPRRRTGDRSRAGPARRAAGRPRRSRGRSFAASRTAWRSRLQPHLQPVRSWRSTSAPCRSSDCWRISSRFPPWRPPCGSAWSRPLSGSSARCFLPRARSHGCWGRSPRFRSPTSRASPSGAPISGAAGSRSRCARRWTWPRPTC